MGRVLQRLVMWLAFVGAFVVPAIARAALLPACEHDPSTRTPVEWLPVKEAALHDADDACNLPPAEAQRPDDLGDMHIAALCDARGASAIAPARVHTVGDARIDAVAGPGADAYTPVIGPGPRHSPVASAAPALADHAVLDATVAVPSASSELAAPFPPVTGGPRCGIARGIDHPPR